MGLARRTCIPLEGASCFEPSDVAGDALIHSSGGNMYEKGRLSTMAAVESINTRSLEDFRLRTVSRFKVEATLSRPGARLAVCRYGWDAALAPTAFRSDAHYLDFALLHRRAGFQVAYLGRSNRHVVAASGDCCFVPAGHEMLVRCPEGEQRVLACQFDPGALRPYFDWEWTPLKLAECFDINNLQIRSSLSRIAEEVLCPGFATDVVVDAALSTLMVDLHRYFHGSPDTTPRSVGRLAPHKWRLLEDLIHSADPRDTTVERLASRCGFSARHLSRMFRNTTGKTLGDFVAEVRVARAKRRLADRDGLIKEIAYECGFRSQSAFAHAFKRATGQTPQQYRQNSSH
jgi:AraC family transcriptional regulator